MGSVTPRFLLERDKHVTWASDTLKEHAKPLTCKSYHFFLLHINEVHIMFTYMKAKLIKSLFN